MAQGKKLNCKVISNGIEYEITTDHPIYRLRYTIMTRCYNAAPRDYKFYQGKGIEVCDLWKNDFIHFFKWCLDNGWQKGLVLDRIDNNKNYVPENCRFITHQENLKKMHEENNLRGEKAGNSKLTYEQVKEIKRLLAIGVMCTRLSKDFGVARTTIQAIKQGKNWKDPYASSKNEN